jgi:hypothetical protein
VKIFAAIAIVLAASACTHAQIDASSRTSSAPGPARAGASVTSGSAGLQVQGGSRSLAAAIVVLGLAAGAVEYSREERSFPSPAALLPQRTPPAPELAPDRRVSEQDCTRPVDYSLGNIRCK